MSRERVLAALRGVRLALAWAVFVSLPLGFRLADEEPSLVIEGVLLGLLALWFGKGRARGVIVALWALLVVFEGGMAAGRMIMSEDPVIYDGLQLLWHLGVLTSDLYGYPTLAGLVLSGLLVFALAVWGAWHAVGWLGSATRKGWWALSLVLLAPAVPLDALPTSATVLGADRSYQSWLIFSRIEGFRSNEATAPLMAVGPLEKKPDVRVYIVESYGMTMFRSPHTRRWRSRVGTLQKTLEQNGWYTANIRSNAPTRGGRSWICDAAFLLGRHIRYQAEFNAVAGRASDLDHLPKWFDQRGYETVLARPADRERPGVPLANKYAFQRTLFFEDFNYRGPPVGWGRIPDQYTVGFLHANAFRPPDGRPQFSFVHLATSHYPWQSLPRLKASWRMWNTHTQKLGARKPRKMTAELWLMAKQFTRRGQGKGREVDARGVVAYMDAVDHGLTSINRELAALDTDRPTIAFILGDHQPPFISGRRARDVPVHIAANDPKLLKEWFDAGASKGWQPSESVVQHASFFSRIVRMIARYNDLDLPPVLEDGTPP